MKGDPQLQICWDVIHLTDKNHDNFHIYQCDKHWSIQNAKPKIYIRDNIDEEGMSAIQHLESACQI